MGELVEFASNGGTDQGWLALPPSGRGPGVIVIQEWWGLVPHIKDVAERLASEGFVALAPDFYHGQSTTEPDQAQKLAMELQFQQVTKDFAGAVHYLLAQPAVTSEGVGVIGFCMGGGLTLALAASEAATVRAAVPFYGGLPGPAGSTDFSRSQAAFQGHYAEHDDWVGADGAQRIERELRAAGREAEFFTYPGTSHAFFNDSRPSVYNAAAAALAWSRTTAFLHAKLG
jgi:carboxymethylenebutenolidase